MPSDPKELTSAEIEELVRLEKRAEWGPWIVVTDPAKIGNDWMIASCGYDGEVAGDVTITTDHLHASECRSEGPTADAEFIVALRNHGPRLLGMAQQLAEVRSEVETQRKRTETAEGRAKYLSTFLEEAATAAACGKDPAKYLATSVPTDLRDRIATLEAKVEAQENLICDFKAASMLCGKEGDPAEVQPRHIEQHITELTHRNEALEGQLAKALDGLRAAAKMCELCHGKGRYEPHCFMCRDSSYDHVCSEERDCTNEKCAETHALLSALTTPEVPKLCTRCGQERTARGGDVHCSGDRDNFDHDDDGGCHRFTPEVPATECPNADNGVVPHTSCTLCGLGQQGTSEVPTEEDDS
jgi:hypothetical protein